MSGNEVLKNRKTFLKVRHNGVLDNLIASATSFLRLGHKTTHTRELTNLFLTTTSTRVIHHIDGVEALIISLELLHQSFCELVVGVGPDIDNVVITLVIGDKTHGVLGHNFLNLFVGLFDKLFFLSRDDNIAQVEGKTTTEGLTITHVLNVIKEGCSHCIATLGEDVTDDVTQRLLTHNLVDVAILVRHNLIENDATDSSAEAVGLDIVALLVHYDITILVALHLILGAAVHSLLGRSIAINIGKDFAFLIFDDLHKGLVSLNIAVLVLTFRDRHLYTDAGIEIDSLLVVGDDDLLCGIETLTFTLHNLSLGSTTRFGHVIQTKHHILRRNGNRSTVSGVEDVMCGEHQQLSFKNSGIAHRHMDGHLVTIEVSVEASTHQGVQTNGLTFHKLGLESLNTETVQRRSTVEQYGVPLQDVLENFPHNGFLTVDNLFCTLDCLHQSTLKKFANDVWFEELSGHILRQTTLMHLQLRSDNNNRTARVVDTLTEQVLTEATLLALEGIGE